MHHAVPLRRQLLDLVHLLLELLLDIRFSNLELLPLREGLTLLGRPLLDVGRRKAAEIAHLELPYPPPIHPLINQLYNIPCLEGQLVI